jgi:hypothetical protein
MARERISRQHLFYLSRKAIEAVAHTDGATCQINFRASCHLDHDILFKTPHTRLNACSSTEASTRNFVPPTVSISIIL